MSGTSPISRRRFLTTTAALGGGSLLGAGGIRPRPARAQGSLKGTKLTIIAGDWYVPETNKMLDDLVASLSKDTGMDVRVERFAGEQQVAKAAAIVGSGQGGDIAVVRDFDAYLYADKLIDVTDLANEVGKTYGGWFDVAQQACVVKGRWKALMIGQAPAAWNYRTDMFRAAGVEKFPDTFDELAPDAELQRPQLDPGPHRAQPAWLSLAHESVAGDVLGDPGQHLARDPVLRDHAPGRAPDHSH
jgi:multiple sugar transport system substrate-binding protein